jgi:hypothetical protein
MHFLHERISFLLQLLLLFLRNAKIHLVLRQFFGAVYELRDYVQLNIRPETKIDWETKKHLSLSEKWSHMQLLQKNRLLTIGCTKIGKRKFS